MDSDEAVLEVRRGNLDAYGVIVAQCEVKVRVVLAMIVPEARMVDDLVQEVFLRAYRLLAGYQPGSDFAAWIKEIARGIGLNERRAWVRHQTAARKHRVRFEGAIEQTLDAASRRNESEALLSVVDCVDQLADTAREVVRRHYWQGMTAQAIGAGMSRTVEWVWVVLHRARLSLARCLESKGMLHGSQPH